MRDRLAEGDQLRVGLLQRHLHRCVAHGRAALDDFFPLGIREGEHVSEDMAPCRNWRALGGKALVDPTLLLRHHGRTVTR